MIEILIVLTILWVLFTLVFQSYTKTAEITLRIEHEKTLINETKILHQYLDNISDQYIIDHSAYTANQSNQNYSIDDEWFTKTLALINKTTNEKIEISSVGQCENNKEIILSWVTSSEQCRIQLDWLKPIKLTDPEQVKIWDLQFKIHPWVAYSWNIFTEVPVERIENQWFWIYWHMYIQQVRNTKRSFNVHMPLQGFFSVED